MENENTPLTTAPASGMSTPAYESERLTFTPRRAMASFDNLVALANHQERLREARKMVWRDRGEPVAELDNLKACLEHAAKGGFRSATLGFNIRACINLVLALIRLNRVPKNHRFALIRHAIFGLDTWRFAAMFGTFTGLYKFLINALPILIPAINPKKTEEKPSANRRRGRGPSLDNPTSMVEVALPEHKARLSLSAHAQMIFLRKKTRRWHAALAGALAGGLAIMWEKRSRRGIIAQQLFVRGLQGTYNSFSTKHNIHIPHGDVLVFALACGQIMFAFLIRPDTLPRSYRNWIGEAAKVPRQCVDINHGLVRENQFDVRSLDQLCARADITPANLTDLMNVRELFYPASASATRDPSTYYPKYAPCSAVHPALTSCKAVPLDRFFAVFKWMLPIYGALHFIPPILFKSKTFVNNPRRVMIRAGLGSIRSSAFLGVFVVIYQTLFCYKHYLHRNLTELKLKPSHATALAAIPQSTIDILISKGSFWLLGFAAGLALFIEEKRRRGELAMYVLPKGLESLWVAARGKGLVFKTGKWGETLLTTIGMAMVMSTYQNDPQHLSGLVRRILYQFIGPN
ncbi:hypothetical protein AMATHDRAFT_152910 [Amanita thiersii Skay4041]|uniref:Transmembrane protein 135 N-terminal domain-containing protein n=1 Tax=Amanita thiersii Skay4041 TaxID=703135 RepID=A0A2A9NCU4_9AGAR|nr:hypothetical protein AMATHDRAFT_152910 [Amanita thiersii Skay4041]